MLRIDDTDTSRKVAGAEQAIMDDLGWLGVEWDEGPVGRASGRPPPGGGRRGRAGPVRDGAAEAVTRRGLQPFVILRSDGRPTYHWATAVDDPDLASPT